ncbi:MAG: ABC transporter permease, partial [Candidatus Paceibacterota bacterium]
TFALILFASLIPYAFFSEVVGSSSSLILGNVNLVKKVKFPLELLPIVRLITVLVQSLFSIAILGVVLLVTNNLHATFIFLPIIFLPLLFFSLGVSFFVSSLNVFIRDTQQIVGVALTLLMFISPIFYPLASIPEHLRKYILLNPFSMIVEQFRAILVIGEMPNIASILVIWTISIAVLVLGFLWFKKTKSAFADVV